MVKLTLDTLVKYLGINYVPTGENKGYYVLPVAEKFGEVIVGRAVSKQYVSAFLKFFKSMQRGGRLVLDFQNVVILSPLVPKKILAKLQEREKSSSHSYRDRYILFKDPNEDIRCVLDYVAAGSNCSPLLYYSGRNSYEILSLPEFLRETIELIRKHGSLTSSELEGYLGRKKGRSAKERSRLLVVRRLVERDLKWTPYGNRFFSYKMVTL